MVQLFIKKNDSWDLLAKMEDELDYLRFSDGRLICLPTKNYQSLLSSLLRFVLQLKNELKSDIKVITPIGIEIHRYKRT